MPLEELFMNVENNSSTEPAQSGIIFPIRYLTEPARFAVKHIGILS